jgi:hypothetical protein
MMPEPEGLASLVVTQIGQVTLVAAAALAAASLFCRNRPERRARPISPLRFARTIGIGAKLLFVAKPNGNPYVRMS